MRNTTILLFAVLFAVLLVGCDAIGGGETVIQGDDNVVVTDDVVDRVAVELAGLETTAAVTDDELTAMFTTIRERALEGELKASLVMLKIASIQRQPKESEE